MYQNSVQLVMKPTDINTSIKTCIDLISYRAKEKNILIEYNIKPIQY